MTERLGVRLGRDQAREALSIEAQIHAVYREESSRRGKGQLGRVRLIR